MQGRLITNYQIKCKLLANKLISYITKGNAFLSEINGEVFSWWWPLTHSPSHAALPMVTWAHRGAILEHYLLSLRLLPKLPHCPSCPPRIPSGKWSLRVENLPRVKKAASRSSCSSNRSSNWGESQSWGTCCAYLVKSQIAEIAPMYYFPLLSGIENNKKPEIQPVKNPLNQRNYFYTLFNLLKYQEYVNI